MRGAVLLSIRFLLTPKRTSSNTSILILLRTISSTAARPPPASSSSAAGSSSCSSSRRGGGGGVGNGKTNQVYLHIAPCGDYWTGYEVFAAKHLNPDYVKSLPIPNNIEFDPEEALEYYDGDLDSLLKEAYDREDFSIIERVWEDENTVSK
jgi:hypothetical protein